MDDRSPRARLLEAAGELFYREGVGSVGVGRIIEEAGVGQMSLWRTFGSKQGLVESWLEGAGERLWAEMAAAVDADASPRENVATLVAICVRRASHPRTLGCPLIKAAAEAQACGPRAREIAARYKEETRATLARLARQDGVRDPDRLAAQLLYLMEGVLVTTGVGVATEAPEATTEAALTLFDAAPRASRGALTPTDPTPPATARRPGRAPSRPRRPRHSSQ